MKVCSYDFSNICLGQCEDFVLSNGKVVSVHAMKAYGGSGGIAPLTVNLGTSSVVFLGKSCIKNGHVCYYYM